MQADGQGGGALAADVGGGGAAEHGHPLAGQAGPQPRPAGAAQELGADRPPAGGVVDEQARAARGSAGQHDPVAVQVQLVTGQPACPVQQLVTAQARVTDQLVEVLHEQGLVEHGEALELDRAVAEGAGLGQPPTVERRVGGGVADDGLQALLLMVGQLGPWPLLTAGLGSGQPQGRGHVGQAPPLIANLAVHRILRSCWVAVVAGRGLGRGQDRVQQQPPHAPSQHRVHRLGLGQPLQAQPDLQRVPGQRHLAGRHVGGQGQPAVLGQLSHRLGHAAPGRGRGWPRSARGARDGASHGPRTRRTPPASRRRGRAARSWPWPSSPTPVARRLGAGPGPPRSAGARPAAHRRRRTGPLWRRSWSRPPPWCSRPARRPRPPRWHGSRG